MTMKELFTMKFPPCRLLDFCECGVKWKGRMQMTKNGFFGNRKFCLRRLFFGCLLVLLLYSTLTGDLSILCLTFQLYWPWYQTKIARAAGILYSILITGNIIILAHLLFCLSKVAMGQVGFLLDRKKTKTMIFDIIKWHRKSLIDYHLM